MTGSVDHNDPTDAWLVAYLDGALDEKQTSDLLQTLAQNPELEQRLDLLKRGSRDFKQAFEPLLTVAPEDRMQNMLSGLIAQTSESNKSDTAQQAQPIVDNVVPLRPKQAGAWQGFGRMAAAAGIAVAIFSGGVYTGWETGKTPPVATAKIGWRQAAAQYVSLYSKQTLDGYPVDPDIQKKGWLRVSTALDLELSRKKAQIDHLTLKGTQLLQLKGKPLVQIAYLHNGTSPVALCIIKSNKASFEQKTEQRLGLNIVHWVEGGYGYMLIGKIQQQELQKIAAPLKSRFS